MKSSELFKQVIAPVNCKYGAPMGRCDVGTPTGKVFKRKVPVNSGGYDCGGAYWGLGPTLYVEYNSDLSYIRFFRQ